MTDQSYPMLPASPGFGGYGALEPAAGGPTWEPPPAPAKPRRPMLLFDRVKIFILMAAWIVFSLWRFRTEQPAYTMNDALIEVLRRQSWVLVLGLLEVVRQIHYLISEHNAGYNAFWVDKVWGEIDHWKERRNPWLRYRTARYAKFLAAYLLFAAFLAHSRHVSFGEGVGAVPSSIWTFLTHGPDQVPFWVNLLFPMLFIVGQFGFLFWFLSRGGVDVYMPEDIVTTFDDVWGQDAVVSKVKENIVFLEDPEAIEDRGGHVPGGILLWGPPGTGKTLMAEAVAGETGKPYVFVDPGAFINMFMGVGILKVKSLFRKLRKLSLKYGGVIVFFDEADSLGNRGSGGGAMGMNGVAASPLDDHARWLSPNAQALLHEEARSRQSIPDEEPPKSVIRRVMVGGMGGGGGGMGTLQALLSEISGLKKPRGFLNRTVRRFFGLRPKPPLKYRMLIMMATNMPGALDDAMLRPGRLDRIYKVGYPSKDGRRRTYEGYLKKVRHQLTPEQIDKLAVITPYATGAVIKDLVNEALINALRHGRDAVTWEDIVWAKHFKSLGPPEDVEYVERERHAIAVHEGCHAVAHHRLVHNLAMDLATIEKGASGYLGMVAFAQVEDLYTAWKSDHEADIMVSLASLAGERLFFDADSSSGVAGDLQQATALAARMEGYWGMGSTISSHAVSRNLGIRGPEGPGGPEGNDMQQSPLGGKLGERVEANLARLMTQAEELIKANWFEVLSVAHALETYKTLSGDDVVAVIEGTQGPLIDGRIYATQQMRDELAAYHELAAAAHRAHGRVEATLPQVRLPYGPNNGSVIDVPAYQTYQAYQAYQTGPVQAGPAGQPMGAPVYPQAGPPAAAPMPMPMHHGGVAMPQGGAPAPASPPMGGQPVMVPPTGPVAYPQDFANPAVAPSAEPPAPAPGPQPTPSPETVAPNPYPAPNGTNGTNGANGTNGHTPAEPEAGPDGQANGHGGGTPSA